MPNIEPIEQEPKNGKLSPKQLKFCEEYLIDLNGTQAAIRAGYKKKYAQQQATENLLKPLIRKFITKLKKRISAKAVLTAQETLEEASIVARSSLENYVDIDELTGVIRAKGFKEMPKDSIRALQSVEENRAIKEDADGKGVTVYDKVKFKTHPKMRAIEFLGKYHGLGEDNKQLPGNAQIDNRNINITFVHVDSKGKEIENVIKKLKKMSVDIIDAEVVEPGNNK